MSLHRNREWRRIFDTTALDRTCDPLRIDTLHRVLAFRARRSYLPIPQAHCIYRTINDENKTRSKLTHPSPYPHRIVHLLVRQGR